MSKKPEPLRAMAGPLYFFALVLIVSPFLDLAVAAWPIQLGNPGWRFGTVGLLGGSMNLPILGLLLAFFVSVEANQRLMQRTLAIVLAVGAVGFVLLFVGFVLDGVQLRASVTPEAMSTFDRAMGKALLNQLLIIVLLSWLSLKAFKVSRSGQTGDSKPKMLVTPSV